jgi:ferredoxin
MDFYYQQMPDRPYQTAKSLAGGAQVGNAIPQPGGNGWPRGGIQPDADGIRHPHGGGFSAACGACNDICPVGNEPMRDILDIRRHLVLMENAFPEQLQAAYRGMERTSNPWGIAADKRLEWAAGLNVPTVADRPHPELLWWVGCAPATDPRAQKTAQAFARVLQAAGVEYAVLGLEEKCTGDSARRSETSTCSRACCANVTLRRGTASHRRHLPHCRTR